MSYNQFCFRCGTKYRFENIFAVVILVKIENLAWDYDMLRSVFFLSQSFSFWCFWCQSSDFSSLTSFIDLFTRTNSTQSQFSRGLVHSHVWVESVTLPFHASLSDASVVIANFTVFNLLVRVLSLLTCLSSGCWFKKYLSIRMKQPFHFTTRLWYWKCNQFDSSLKLIIISSIFLVVRCSTSSF